MTRAFVREGPLAAIGQALSNSVGPHHGVRGEEIGGLAVFVCARLNRDVGVQLMWGVVFTIHSSEVCHLGPCMGVVLLPEQNMIGPQC